MPSIDKKKVGFVYVDQYSKYENLTTVSDSSVFLIKDNGIYVGQNTVANYVNTDSLLSVADASLTYQLKGDYVLSSSLAEVAFNGSYDYLEDRPVIPTKLSDLINDSSFITTQTTKINFAFTNNSIVFTDSSGNTISHVTVKNLIDQDNTCIQFLKSEEDTGIEIYEISSITTDSVYITHYDNGYLQFNSFYWNDTEFEIEESFNTRLLTESTDSETIEDHFIGLRDFHKTSYVSKTPAASVTINPYVFNNFGTVSQSMNIVFNTSAETSGKIKEYIIRFIAGSGCAVSLPNGVLYANGAIPTYIAGHTYEINIVNGCAVVAEFY